MEKVRMAVLKAGRIYYECLDCGRLFDTIEEHDLHEKVCEPEEEK